MADRFDLMEPADILAALRVSSQWCSVVNRTDLHDDDLLRLHKATQWLSAMTVEFDAAVTNARAIDQAAFDEPPRIASLRGDPQAIVEDFRRAIEAARSTLATLDSSRWSANIPFGDGTSVVVKDLGRHIARVAQIAGVDRQWIWQTA